MLTEQQIAQRAEGVGCSELFDILVDPYRVWHPKVTGKSRFTGDEPFIKWGNILERPTAEDYADRRAQGGDLITLGITATPKGDAVTLQDRRRDWLMGTPDFLPILQRVGGSERIPDLATIARLADAGAIDRGLEIKTGSAHAETHADEEDRWGEGARASDVDLIDLFSEYGVAAPAALSQEVMRRWSLQAHLGVQDEEEGEDAWGDPALCQLPRRYILQAQGYMAITGLRRWDLHRLRFGWGRIETVTYPIFYDPEIIGAVLEHAERFVVDYLKPRKPPARRTLEQMRQEAARVWPRDDGSFLPLTVERAALLERYREACQALKRAEVSKDFIQAILAAEVGDAKGIDGGKDFKVSYGARAGRVTVDARAAVAGMVERLAGVVDRETLERAAAEAIADATKKGDDYRAWSRPQSWTKGIEAEVLAAMQGGER